MKRIGIIGAGISGLVFASLIRENPNFEITIFEKDQIQNNSINGIQLSPNAMAILDKLKFSNFNKDKFFNIRGINFFDICENKKISTMSFDYLNRNQYISLNRSDLINFLINEFLLQEIIINKCVKQIDNNKVILEDQSEVSFDILIVSDGIFSKIRPKNIKPIYSGYSAYRGFFKNSVQKEYIDLFLGKDFHLVCYPIDKLQNSSFTMVEKTSQIHNDSEYNFEIKNFKEKLKNFSISNLEDIANCTKVKMWPIFKLNKIFYGEKDMFFIGDSAHGFIPSRAQGAAQAIEDSYALYKFIIAKNLSAKKFYDFRASRINKIKKKSENNLVIFHMRFFLLRWIRNFIIKIICFFKPLTKIFNSFIFDYKIDQKL